jgi:hypothetical protein
VIVTSRSLLLMTPLVFAGCPLGPTESDATVEVPSIEAVAGSAAEQGGDALSALAQQAEGDRFPPPPSLNTLCMLVAGSTDYKTAKEIVGEPQGQSQDAMMAGLSYRFRPASSGGAAGSAGDGGAAGSGDQAEPITLYLSFAWSDGQPGVGTMIFGFGGSAQDFLTGYILDKMSISGMPYPDCWPHEED